jgi:hypothetical protein
MHLKFKVAVLVTSIAAAILLAGCGTTYTYTGPPLLFGAGGTAPSCPTCFISGTFTVNSPLGCASSSLLCTYPDLRVLTNGKLTSFDFTISGWTLGGTPPEWSSTNGAIINRFGVTLDSSSQLGNWNIQITSSDRTTFFATCNATAAFKTEFPAPPAREAGFPSGAACDTPAPQKDTFSGGGNTLLTGNGPGVMK